MPDLAPNYPQCRGAAPGPYVPSGPTPEQIKQRAIEQDRQEGATDANDKGAEAYRRGDYDEAVRWFKEAHDLDPNDADVASNLQKAYAMAAEKHSRETLASKPSGPAAIELETLGGKPIERPNPKITVLPLNKRGDPILTPAQRKAHPKVAEMEEMRETQRRDMAAVEAEIKSPKTDPAALPALKAQVDAKKRTVADINMSIKLEVLGPAAK